MAFDGGFLHKIVQETAEAIDCHIDKLYQPSRDVLVFLLRKKGFAKRLLMCARPGAARMQFTEMKFENPPVAPMFCMLARKHFSGARLVEVRQNALERVVEFLFETTDEMGDRVKPRIICELIGNQSNIILVDDSNHIIDAVHRSDPESGKRMILPGALYTYPEREEKLDLSAVSPSEIVSAVMNKSGLLSKALLDVGDGFSPLIAREIAFRAFGDDIEIGKITDTERLISEIADLKVALTSENRPCLLLGEDGMPKDFSYWPITQYGTLYKVKTAVDFSALLDTFYAERDRKDRIRHAASDMLKIVRNAKNRAQKRMAARREELLSCADREHLRIYGELIKANLYAIENGSSQAVV
ncbi:MAG: NFACT family protein, partial [Clostridia bacterium]|nr:NFACT family protein [Clostridia bacterium]